MASNHYCSIAGHTYRNWRSASINLHIASQTLIRIHSFNYPPAVEEILLESIQQGYQLYGKPFFIEGRWFVSKTHLSDQLGISRSTLEYRMKNGNLKTVVDRIITENAVVHKNDWSQKTPLKKGENPP